SLPKGSNVLPGLQDGRDGAAAGVGDSISAGAVPAEVLLQLLVGAAGTDDCARVESRQLQRAAAEDGLLADALAFDVDRRPRDVVFSAAGISAGIFSFVLRWHTKR